MRFIALTLTALAAAAVLASSALAAPKLSPAERKAINRAVDTFVFHAVRHKNAAAAYDVVSPNFRAGMTRAEFGRNDPAYPFPARGKHYHWSLDYVQPNEVGASILLQPEKRFIRRKGPILFDLIVIKHEGRWVVQSLIPKVIFGTPYKPKVVSVRDYSPTGAGNEPMHSESRINGDYIVIPFALFGALLAGLVGWGVVRWYRDRRIDLDSARDRDARLRASRPLTRPR
jgi:hypothetical protein